MKIETKYYGVFYKDKNKWRGPAHGELLTLNQIKDEYGNTYEYLKQVRKQFRKPIKLLRQIWTNE